MRARQHGGVGDVVGHGPRHPARVAQAGERAGDGGVRARASARACAVPLRSGPPRRRRARSRRARRGSRRARSRPPPCPAHRGLPPPAGAEGGDEVGMAGPPRGRPGVAADVERGMSASGAPAASARTAQSEPARAAPPGTGARLRGGRARLGGLSGGCGGPGRCEAEGHRLSNDDGPCPHRSPPPAGEPRGGDGERPLLSAR